MSNLVTEIEREYFQLCTRVKDLSYLLTDELSNTGRFNDYLTTAYFLPDGQINSINMTEDPFQLPDPTPYGDLEFYLTSITNTEPHKTFRTVTANLILDCDRNRRCNCRIITGVQLNLEDPRYQILTDEQPPPLPVQQDEQGEGL